MFHWNIWNVKKMFQRYLFYMKNIESPNVKSFRVEFLNLGGIKFIEYWQRFWIQMNLIVLKSEKSTTY
jgi:hypothetical protein